MIFKSTKEGIIISGKEVSVLLAENSAEVDTINLFADNFKSVGEYESMGVMITAMTSSDEYLESDFYQLNIDGISIIVTTERTKEIKLSKHQKEVLSDTDVILCAGVPPKNVEELVSDNELFGVIFLDQSQKLSGVDIEEVNKKLNFRDADLKLEEKVTKYYAFN